MGAGADENGPFENLAREAAVALPPEQGERLAAHLAALHTRVRDLWGATRFAAEENETVGR